MESRHGERVLIMNRDQDLALKPISPRRPKFTAAMIRLQEAENILKT